MNKDCYQFSKRSDGFTYTFISEGIRGRIVKGVLISPLYSAFTYPFSSVYNLAFGDLVPFHDTWMLDDSVRSGNGDMPKVIATVVRIAMDFLVRNHNSILSFEGYMDEKSVLRGKNHRNLLYQRAINSNWAELSKDFKFWGASGRKIDSYSVGIAYDTILVGLI
ncbi:DUF6934 family protein [Dyadobacter jiangsuensis]|uniref:Uncharacterized protein n=1 Tax=Dyadobacter jiangsuensis TaxID=1591085 RepID=A0A2P8FWE1_9BACT|nr:hypothetical protein [Dyadobacter jiangsuensis]PSL26036.1 hypothetical protein CLV60_11014 [Dyadobacter jiangsuensis]